MKADSAIPPQILTIILVLFLVIHSAILPGISQRIMLNGNCYIYSNGSQILLYSMYFLFSKFCTFDQHSYGNRSLCVVVVAEGLPSHGRSDWRRQPLILPYISGILYTWTFITTSTTCWAFFFLSSSARLLAKSSLPSVSSEPHLLGPFHPLLLLLQSGSHSLNEY